MNLLIRHYHILITFTIAFIFYLPNNANARSSNTDSLKIVLSKHRKENRSKVDLLNKIALQSFEYNVDDLGSYSKKALTLSQKLKYKKGESAAYCNLGFWFMMLHGDAASLIYLDKAKKIAISINDTMSIARSLNGLGCYYSTINNNRKALIYFKRALKIIGDRDLDVKLAYINNVGSSYEEIEEYDKAIYYYNEELALALRLKNYDYISSSYENLSSLHYKRKDYIMALSFMEKSSEVAKKHPSTHRQALYNNILLGDIYYDMQKPDTARLMYKKAIQIAQQMNSTERQIDVYHQLYKLDSLQGNSKSALANYIKYTNFKDSLLNKENFRITALYNVKFDIQRRDNENRHLKSIGEKDKNVIRAQQWILLISIVLGLFIVGGLFSFRNASRELSKKNRIISLHNQVMSKNHELKDKLFSVISHDLRSPITQVYSMVELIADGELDREETMVFLPKIKKATSNALETLDNLLIWSKNQLEGFKLKPVEFNLKNLVSDLLNKMSPSIEAKQQTIEQNIKSTNLVYADLDMITIVIRNLISNAVKFTSIGGVIKFNAKIEDSFIVLDITDNGIGMNSETLGLLFTTISHTTRGTENERGTGLGLKLCKDFIELNGGKISVQSELGKGSIFTITIPTLLSK